MADQPVVATVDARNLSCPMPIVKTAQQMKSVASGQLVEVLLFGHQIACRRGNWAWPLAR